MAFGEAVAARILTDVAQAQRAWLRDQHAEDAATARQSADRPARRLIDPEREELL
jgi:hypothetical protein